MSPNHETVVEGNHIGTDQILVGWIDSNFRNPHVRARWKARYQLKWCTYMR